METKSEMIVGNLQNEGDDHYHDFLNSIRDNFNKKIESGNVKLFNVGANNTFKLFLSKLPKERQQHYTCDKCTHFVKHFGNLVEILPTGELRSVIWDETNCPEFFRESVKALKELVEKRVINNIFRSEEAELGTPVTDEWTHMSVTLPESMLTKEDEKVPDVVDFKMLQRGVTEYNINTINNALKILKTNSLDRSEKFVDNVEWLKEVMIKVSETKNIRYRDNIIWSYVANAPTGFCKIKNSMVGTFLLDSIQENLSFDSIERRWKKEINGLKYQRSQVAPSSGNVKRAEELVKQGLLSENSLERRFARLDELQLIWQRRETEIDKPTNSGVFSHLKTKDKIEEKEPVFIDIKPVNITFRKFKETVMNDIKEMELYVGYTMPFTAIVTSINPEDKPIIKWDTMEQRNPFSWYLYAPREYNTPRSWNLHEGFVKVTGICYKPSMWNDGDKYKLGEGIMLLLDGCKDNVAREGTGNGLMPEIILSKLHEVRSTIEAYGQSATVQGKEDASACGVLYQDGNIRIRTIGEYGKIEYIINGWD